MPILQTIGPVRLAIAIVTFSASLASWVYRFIDEYTRWPDVWLYILVPLVIWLLFAGPLLMTSSARKWLRVIAYLLLAPTTFLWGVSILVGMYGLKIH